MDKKGDWQNPIDGDDGSKKFTYDSQNTEIKSYQNKISDKAKKNDRTLYKSSNKQNSKLKEKKEDKPTTKDEPVYLAYNNRVTTSNAPEVTSSVLQNPPQGCKFDAIVFLILVGVFIVSAAVYIIINYCYLVDTNNSTEQRKTKQLSTLNPKTDVEEVEEAEKSESISTIITANFTPSDLMDSLFQAKTDLFDLFQSSATVDVNPNQENQCLLGNIFCKDDVIEVLTSFHTDTRNGRPLPEGMRLIVVDVDAKGDLKVRHPSWTSNSWIFKKNYGLITTKFKKTLAF